MLRGKFRCVHSPRMRGGLMILHSGNVTINERATIGHNCIFAGMNCVGVDDITGENAHYPVIGNNVFIGVGANIIGNVRIPNNCIIAAGSIVVNSFTEEGVVLAGVPAKIIKRI